MKFTSLDVLLSFNVWLQQLLLIAPSHLCAAAGQLRAACDTERAL